MKLLHQQNKNLIRENASKNTITKILAEKHTFDYLIIQIQNWQYLKNLKRLIANFEKKKSRPRKHKKVDLNCSNFYETFYITDSNIESVSEDSDDITITDTSTDNNLRPGYTHRIYQ